MARGRSVVGAILKWSLVLVLGAAVGGYVVFLYRGAPLPTTNKPDDTSTITPGSDSGKPDKPTPDPVPAPPPVDAGDTAGAVQAPEGQTGPDVEIEVKPSPVPLPPRRHKPKPKAPVDANKPGTAVPSPTETTPPDQGGTTGATTTTGGSDGGDTGGDTGGTTAGN